MVDPDRLRRFISGLWGDEIVPTLVDYIRIPNKSPHFDPQWREHGYMDEAVKLFEGWARQQARGPAGRHARGGASARAHAGDPDRHPRQRTRHRPALRPPGQAAGDDRLGRGPRPLDAGDQGRPALRPRRRRRRLRPVRGAWPPSWRCASRASPHARCVILIEACEELGSYDLPYYVDHLAGKIGSPSLVICLDSGCGDYERLWLTTSLRGLTGGQLTVEVLTEGVHSGDASGVVRRQLPHRALAALAAGGRQDRRDPARGPVGRRAPGPAGAGPPRRRDPGRPDLDQVPVRGRHAAGGGRSGRADPEPHLAAAARHRRRRGPAGAVQRRQCAAPRHDAEAVAAPAADAEGGASRGPGARDARRRTRPTAPRSPSRSRAPSPAGTRPRSRPGSRRPSSRPPRRPSARPRR